MDELLTEALHARYDPIKRNTPYGDDRAYIRDLLSLVSLCLMAASGYKEALLESGDDENSAMHSLSGTAMSIDEALDHVGAFCGEPPPSDESLVLLVEMAWAHIESRLAAAKASGLAPRLERLRKLLGLSDFSFFCVACALSCALDRGFESLFTALHGDEALLYPTLGVARSLYSLAWPNREAGWLADPASAENRLVFQSAPLNTPPLLRPLMLRTGIFSHILGDMHISRELAACSVILDGSNQEIVSLFLDKQRCAAQTALQRMRPRKEPRLCVLCGAAGSGRKLTLKRLAMAEGVRFLLVRLDELPENARLDDVADELLSLALLKGIIPCFSMAEPASDTRFARILAVLAQYRTGVFLLADSLRKGIAADRYLVTRVDFPQPNLAQSLHFWQLFSAEYEIDESVDWESFAAKYVLNAGQIKTALATAADMAGAGHVPIDGETLDTAILLGNTGRLSEIADKIDVFYTWDDLVLGEASKQMLREVCNRVKYRYLVEKQWGYGDKSAYGKGVSILLYGPPGTGKTMSAQVIAEELGLPLYRINLAQIISKYIGETAKNLDVVFHEAKSSNVILFFDEADALFAKRTDVKNSNDRHANSESSYLLQKIEEYSGISILATNLANNFDGAFRRRINYIINIHMPSPVQRLELWRSSVPEKAPLASDVDLRMLADNLEFSGSVIKSAALQAAYFAASENAQIGMTHMARAIRWELQKLGKSEPHFLTMYPDA